MSDETHPRRYSDAEIHALVNGLNELKSEFRAHRASCDDRHQELHWFIEHTFPDHAEAEQVQLRVVAEAFTMDDLGRPDYAGHRKAHAAMIAAAQAQEEFYKGLYAEIKKKGALALLVTALGLLWVGIRSKLGLPIVP